MRDSTRRPRARYHFDIADQDFSGYAWDFPTIVDGRELVCRGVYHLKLDERDVDIRARLDQRLRERGLDITRYKQKRFAERGFEPHQPYAAPRVALVGEAAGIDAVTGEGIAQAIQYGAFAGPYLAGKARSGDYRFADWNARLAREQVGVDLKIRHWLEPERAESRRHRHRQPTHLHPPPPPPLGTVLLNCNLKPRDGPAKLQFS
jgi:flavin-dependent dehydrogenase